MYPLTFHRAFDRTADLAASLEACIELGLERILTSGGVENVDCGMEALARLQLQAGGRIVILPGGGVRADNAEWILTKTGVAELHLSGRRPVIVGLQGDDRVYEVDRVAVKRVREIMGG